MLKRAQRGFEAPIKELIAGWLLAPLAQARQALRGVDLIVAVTCATEIGDLSRFEKPLQPKGYLGLTPSERLAAAASPRPATVGHGGG